jgi:hypothetical protein
MARSKQTEHRRGLLIKLLSQEKEIIRQQAHLAGLTVSEFIRKCALNRQIRSQVSREVAAELSKLFGLQKHLLMKIKGLPYEECFVHAQRAGFRHRTWARRHRAQPG